ncbi:MAG: MoxR family ATPase [Lachnospiraceae bacterium]|nr:MoxR family ATPase [Lachnospiraceae bacterium]
MNEITKKIQDNVNSVIIGKEEVVKKVLVAILAEGHILLEDVPGVGKTTLAVAFAKTLGLKNARVQFTSDTLPSDIVGFSVYDKDSGNLSYKQGVVITNLLLADEINRTSSKTQSALLEVMEERQVTVDGVTHEVPNPFTVIATQNPVGSAGTTLLPSAQLDRFLIRINIGYPDTKSQIELLKERHLSNPIDTLAPVTDQQGVLALIEEANKTFVSDPVYEFIVNLVEETRYDEYLDLGVSPRGSLAICKMAKAYAFTEGRDYVLPEDVLAIFADVCCHRIVLSSKAKISKLSDQEVISSIIQRVKVPQVK